MGFTAWWRVVVLEHIRSTRDSRRADLDSGLGGLGVTRAGVPQ